MTTGRAQLVVWLALAAIIGASLLFSSCSRQQTSQAASTIPASQPQRTTGEIHITGVVQAVQSVRVVVPRIQSQTNMLTLTHLIPNGSQVKEGDLIATFDAAPQLDAAREAQAKFEDLGHQVEQKVAENRANAAKRESELRQAEGDLAKAEIQLSKGPILSEIDRLKNEARAAGAREHLQSLKKSMAFRDKSEAAGLRTLELQRDRQRIAMERAKTNIEQLEIHAPLAGMAVHELTYRSGSMGHAQIGDQIYRGYPLISIFDPAEMQVRCTINEPDILASLAGRAATVTFDAYPELSLPAHFVFASPIASSPLGTSIKSFQAIFRIDRPDTHLLPDLSAAVVLAPMSANSGAPR